MAGEILVLGDPISALEALELGLITRIVPAEELHDAADERATRLRGEAGTVFRGHRASHSAGQRRP